ncbi:hypothetical protein Aperf_G00000065336 [Anoplocephala perfoliata]
MYSSPRFWRILVLLLSFVTFLLGLCTLGIGLFIYFEHCRRYYILTQVAIPATLMVIGSSTIVMASLGYVGAFYNNRCILKVFAALYFLIFLAQVAFGLSFYQLRTELIPMGMKEIRALIAEANKSEESDARLIMDQLQSQYKCCGGSNGSDWRNNTPISCCVNPNHLTLVCPYPGPYVRGCASSIFHYFEATKHLWCYQVIVLFIIEFLFMVAAWQLVCQLSVYDQLLMVE